MSDFESGQKRKSRLQRMDSSAEDGDDIEVSDQSDLQIDYQPQKKRNQRVPKEAKAPRQPREPKAPKEPKEPRAAKKTQKVSNEVVLENMLQKSHFTIEEDDDDIPIAVREDNQEVYGIKMPKEKKEKQAKSMGVLIKNRHKFFSEFEGGQVHTQFDDDNEIPCEDSLKFERNGVSAKKDFAHIDFRHKIDSYKQNVSLFQQNHQENNKIEFKPNSNPVFGLKRTVSLTPAPIDILLKEDAIDIQIYIPKINGNKNTIQDTTLFFNKLKQQGAQRLARQQSVESGANSMQMNSRSEFMQSLKNNKQKTSNLTLDQLMNRYQETSLNQLEKQKMEQAAKKADTESDDSDVKFDDQQLNEESEDIEESENEKSHNEKSNTRSNKQPSNVEDQKEVSTGSHDSNKHKTPEGSDIDENSKMSVHDVNAVEDNNSNQIESEEDIYEPKITNQVLQPTLTPEDLIEEDEKDDIESEIDPEDLKNFSRLRKISQLIKSRKQLEFEKQEKRRLREVRRKELEQMRKQIRSEYVENQAELGSDNEENDHVVKQHSDSSSEEEVEQELVDLIDNDIADINSEDEHRAFRIFMDRMHDQEKEDIKKILRGEFKRNGKTHVVDLEDLQNHEIKKKELIVDSPQEDYDSEEEQYIKMNQQQKQEFLKEKKLQQILHSQNLIRQEAKLLKKEEQQLFDPEVLKMVRNQKSMQPKRQPSFLETKQNSMTNEIKKNNNGKAISRLFSQNLTKPQTTPIKKNMFKYQK